MRSIVTISLPEELKKEMDKAVKGGRYASKSEFMRHLFRLWEEEKVAQELRKSREEILTGKGKTLKSLKDLR